MTTSAVGEECGHPRGWCIKTVLPAPAHAQWTKQTRAASLFSSLRQTVSPWGYCDRNSGWALSRMQPKGGWGWKGHRAGTQGGAEPDVMGTGASEARFTTSEVGAFSRDRTARTTGAYQFRAATPRWDQNKRAVEMGRPCPTMPPVRANWLPFLEESQRPPLLGCMRPLFTEYMSPTPELEGDWKTSRHRIWAAWSQGWKVRLALTPRVMMN